MTLLAVESVESSITGKELRYNKSMPEKKTDFEKLMKERNAAVLLRDEIRRVYFK